MCVCVHVPSGQRAAASPMLTTALPPARWPHPTRSPPTSSWFSVFSRSSLPPANPARPRTRPMASISSAGRGAARERARAGRGAAWLCSAALLTVPGHPTKASPMKIMDGAWARACANRSRTRAGPTPTNISMKSEPDRGTEGGGTGPRSVGGVRRRPGRATPRSARRPGGRGRLPAAPCSARRAGRSGAPRTRDGEEGHSRLPRRRLGQQRLAGACSKGGGMGDGCGGVGKRAGLGGRGRTTSTREGAAAAGSLHPPRPAPPPQPPAHRPRTGGAHEQGALRDLGSQLLVLAGVFEEVDKLHNLNLAWGVRVCGVVC